ncbi:hypothetical protein HYH03_018240 [Edaphochlamys debaryana]|uniref:Non-structural maintenance of chromosomes element 4 n=1 Tax=Edaphochlamys debaryana TaxID=47281 RepID=A0A835XGA3_9CHLO|nr:hypothetical protein HYH03_018240 [Edaphochlamys debaryana]|eukprot:KAG2482849.1 hypothetical protein HYH03_018240 [Edaphochlamys debaryana]
MADQERRKHLNALKSLKEDVIRKKEDLADINNNSLEDAVTTAEQAVARGAELGCQKAKEVSVQAELLRNLTGCAAEKAGKLGLNKDRGPMDLITALRAAFVHTSNPQYDGEHQPSAFNWREFGNTVAPLFRRATGISCIHGPLDVKPKERKVAAKRAPRKPLGEMQRPDVVAEIAADVDKKDTDRNMEVMWNILRAQPNCTAPYGELVMNHRSFAQTVENQFTLSFLARDNRVRIEQHATLGLVVRALVDGPGGQLSEEQSQFAITIHMRDWEGFRGCCPASACLMPHRSEDDGQGAGQAQGAAQAAKKARR